MQNVYHGRHTFYIQVYILEFISIIRIMEVAFCNDHGIINFVHGKMTTIAIVSNDRKKLFSLDSSSIKEDSHN